MFGANSAVACCDRAATPVASLPGVPALTGVRSVPFPMVDPYSPVRNAAVPVPGFDVWPPRRNVMGRRYYGLGRNSAGTRSRKQRGMGDVFDSFSFTNPYPSTIGGGNQTLQSILSTIQTTLPATISAIKGKPYYDPARQQVVYVGAGGAGAGQSGAVYTTDAQGNVSQVGATLGGAVGNVGDSLGNIVAQHPYLVLLAGAAAVLLFMKPPGRR